MDSTPAADANVRPLRPDDALSLVSLRREALTTEPLAFSSSVADDRGLSVDFVRTSLGQEHDAAVFGYFHGGSLLGMTGLFRLSGVKQRHKGMIWGMYVSPSARSLGAGRALLAAAIDQARGWPGLEQLHLGVTDVGVVARAMYEKAGFRSWGCEPRALIWEGRAVDELHLVLDLRPAAIPAPA